MAELSQEEKDLLAYTLLGEAAGEGLPGMIAVMHVIQNRAESGRYSTNLAAVATQGNASGIHQFSTWNSAANGGNDPIGRYSKGSKAFQTALRAIDQVLSGSAQDPTRGATHFYAAGSKKPYWWDSEAPKGAVRIGNHIFGARNDVSGQARAAPNLENQIQAAWRWDDHKQNLAKSVTGMARNNMASLVPVTERIEGVDPGPRPAVKSEALGLKTGSLVIPAVRGSLTTRQVATVPINPRTGMPYTERDRLEAIRSSSDTQVRGQQSEQYYLRHQNDPPRIPGSRTQYVRDGEVVGTQDVAGSVQLPAGVRPNIEIPGPPKPKPVTQFLRDVTRQQVETSTGFRLPEPRLTPDDGRAPDQTDPALPHGPRFRTRQGMERVLQKQPSGSVPAGRPVFEKGEIIVLPKRDPRFAPQVDGPRVVPQVIGPGYIIPSQQTTYTPATQVAQEVRRTQLSETTQGLIDSGRAWWLLQQEQERGNVSKPTGAPFWSYD